MMGCFVKSVSIEEGVERICGGWGVERICGLEVLAM